MVSTHAWQPPEPGIVPNGQPVRHISTAIPAVPDTHRGLPFELRAATARPTVPPRQPGGAGPVSRKTAYAKVTADIWLNGSASQDRLPGR